MSVERYKYDSDDSDAGHSGFNLSDEMEKMERQLIVNALKKHNGYLNKTADELGLTVSYLEIKIKKHNL